jgi:hypothetical protein
MDHFSAARVASNKANNRTKKIGSATLKRVWHRSVETSDMQIPVPVAN